MWDKISKWWKDHAKVPTKENPNTYYINKPFNNLQALKPATLMLVSHVQTMDGSGLLGWAIRWFTGAPVCHAMVYHGNGIITEAAPQGVIKCGISKYINGRDMIWVFDNPTLTDAQREAICARALRMVGDSYNYADLFTFVGLHLPGHDGKHTEICSQHAFKSFYPDWLIAGPYFIDHPEEVSPGVVFGWITGVGGKPPAVLADTQNVKVES